MDDLQVSYRDPDIQSIETNLQKCIKVLQKYAKRNGFKLSAYKTTMVVFELTGSLTPPSLLKISNNVIPKVESIKFLGITWDKIKLGKNISELKAKRNKGITSCVAFAHMNGVLINTH